MSKMILFAVFVSVVECRRWRASDGISHTTPQSALKTLLLAQASLQSPRLHSRPTHMRRHVARMQAEEPKESPAPTTESAAPKKKAKEPEKGSSGPFEPVVLLARDVIGAKEVQKLRAQIIKEHAGVIANFVATADSAFGNVVLKTLFQIADKDGNGTVDKEELREALDALGFVATTDKDIEKIMKRVDKDKNASLDFEEFKAGAEPILKNQLTQLAKANGHDLGFLVDLKKGNEEAFKKAEPKEESK